MSTSAPKLPDPNAETPGVILGDEGFALSRQLAQRTGQSAKSFRLQAAGQSDPINFLTNLLRQTPAAKPTTGGSGAAASAEPPPRTDPAVQAAGAAAGRRRSRGRSSTIITALEGGLNAANVARKTLLGGFG